MVAFTPQKFLAICIALVIVAAIVGTRLGDFAPKRVDWAAVTRTAAQDEFNRWNRAQATERAERAIYDCGVSGGVWNPQFRTCDRRR